MGAVMKKYLIPLLLALVYLVSFSGISHGATMGFSFLTGDGGDLSYYYSLEVTQGATPGTIDFTFRNIGLSGSITEFYFYDRPARSLPLRASPPLPRA